ncbi:hypothetical protein MCC01989_17060 [Bifidobacteriaceae bacterium MCC01989]|nr:hypothetical protein MCC01989_17060 [Bifidobacteriaceae bacterium MCC01989]
MYAFTLGCGHESDGHYVVEGEQGISRVTQKILHCFESVFHVVLQMFLVSYSSLPTEMTDDYNGRTLLSTMRMIVSGSTVIIPMADRCCR